MLLWLITYLAKLYIKLWTWPLVFFYHLLKSSLFPADSQWVTFESVTGLCLKLNGRAEMFASEDTFLLEGN